MPIDEHATHYAYGNGRFDLMTDEEVRTLTSDELSWLRTCLLDLVTRQQKDGFVPQSGGDFEVRHHLHELFLRYPDASFRLEVLSQSLDV